MDSFRIYSDEVVDVVGTSERELVKAKPDNLELSEMDTDKLDLQDAFFPEFLSQDVWSQDTHSEDNPSQHLQSQDVLSQDFLSHHSLSQVYFPQGIIFQDRLTLDAEMASPLFQEDPAVGGYTLFDDNHPNFSTQHLDEAPAILSESCYFSQYGVASPFAVPSGAQNLNDTSRHLETSRAEPVWDFDSYHYHETTPEASEKMPEITEFLHEEAIEQEQANSTQTQKSDVDNTQEVEVTGPGSLPRPVATLRPVAPPLAYQASSWTDNEKNEFFRLLSIHGTNWELIALNMPAATKGQRKSKKAIQNYYIRSVVDNEDKNMEAIGLAANQRNPSIHDQPKTRVPRYSNWTGELRSEFLKLLRTHGRKWALIAAEMSPMKGKAQSVTTVSNYYYHCISNGDFTVQQIADAAEVDRDEEKEDKHESQSVANTV